MKMVLAIISKEDSHVVSSALTAANFQVTKLASSGGFLRKGNTTLLIGCEKDLVANVIEILKETSSTRMEVVSSATSYDTTNLMAYPIEVQVGGATIFVVDVEQFIKV